MRPDWLPDWKDPEAYPETDDLSLGQWAWQFLRRNPEYQTDFAKWCELRDGLDDPEGRLPMIDQDLSFFVCDPPASDGETYATYRKRVGGKEHGYKTLDSHLGEKYGFRPDARLRGFLPDPREDRQHVWFETSVVHKFAGIPGERGEYVGGPEAFEVLVRFNLEWSIEVQLENARKTLKSLRAYYRKNDAFEPIEKRTRLNKFQFYIRLLDAEVSGAKAGEMAAVLLPNRDNSYPDYGADKNIRDGLKAAQKLRDRDYRYIPLARQK